MKSRIVLAVPLALFCLVPARPARGADPTVPQCLSATEEWLKLRADQKLRQARARLLVCTAASCPAEVREECSRRMQEVSAAIPTVVFEAKDGAGRELSSVKVAMDGEVVAALLDGTAMELNPGRHDFTFEMAGQAPATETLVLREGEKGRHVRIVLGTAPPPAPPPSPVAAPPVAAPAAAGGPERGQGQRVLGLALAGAGLAGGALGGVLGGLTFASWGSANAACPSHAGCSAQAIGDRATALDFGTASTAAFLAAGVLLGGGLTLYFTAPKDRSPGVGLHPAPGGLAGVFP